MFNSNRDQAAGLIPFFVSVSLTLQHEYAMIDRRE